MDKFFNYFKTREINIITKSIRGSQQLPDGSTVQGNVVIEGFLLDQDDHYLYIGETLEEVTDCIAKKDIVRVMLAEAMESLEDEIFEMHDDDGERH